MGKEEEHRTKRRRRRGERGIRGENECATI